MNSFKCKCKTIIFVLSFILTISFDSAAFADTNHIGETGNTEIKNAVWPQFLGPNGDGHVPAGMAMPLKWYETVDETENESQKNKSENIIWKTEIPGKGWSSPVVCDNQIWFTTATEDGKERFAVCVDTESGKILHNILLITESDPAPIVGTNSYASPSCVVEPGRVYVHFGSPGTFCLDTKTGETIWERRDIPCDHSVGAGSSPIPYRDFIIFHADGVDLQYVIALNKADGSTAWKQDRSYDLSGVGKDTQKSFSTPLLRHIEDGASGKRDVILSVGSQTAYAYDPNTGEELAQYHFPGGYSHAAKPVVCGDKVILNTGFDSPRFLCFQLLKNGALKKGILTDADIIWDCNRNITPVPTPVAVDGYLYNVSATGVASCIDVETGEVAWSKRLGNGFWASTLVCGNRVYLFDDSNTCTVIEANPEKCVVLATNELESGCMATPAIKDNSLFLRTKTHLYRIDDLDGKENAKNETKSKSDLKSASTSEQKNTFLAPAPFWKGEYMKGESLFFIQEKPDSKPFAKLLFAPEKIHEVRLTNGTEKFVAGKDYTIEPGSNRVELTADSRIPFMTTEELFPKAGSPNSYAHKLGDTETNLFYSPTQFALNQVEVDYDHAPTLWKGFVPTHTATNLPKTVEKLKKKEPLTITFWGDSITEGLDSSENHKIEPFQPAYPKLVGTAIADRFDSNVTVHNLAVAGMNSQWGVDNVQRVIETEPDLCVIAFGMNDVGARNPGWYKENISKIIDSVKASNPDTEFILVATMLGNKNWVHVPEEMFPIYRDSLAELCENGVVLADLTSMWADLLKTKSFYDLTGNGLNHPNDFGFRIYAEVILELLN
ncbi:MAG: PQQ-binding-like beta-propeller repeat protein [Thermoguttaceae bacterium]